MVQDNDIIDQNTPNHADWLINESKTDLPIPRSTSVRYLQCTQRIVDAYRSYHIPHETGKSRIRNKVTVF